MRPLSPQQAGQAGPCPQEPGVLGDHTCHAPLTTFESVQTVPAFWGRRGGAQLTIVCVCEGGREIGASRCNLGSDPTSRPHRAALSLWQVQCRSRAPPTAMQQNASWRRPRQPNPPRSKRSRNSPARAVRNDARKSFGRLRRNLAIRIGACRANKAYTSRDERYQQRFGKGQRHPSRYGESALLDQRDRQERRRAERARTLPSNSVKRVLRL